MNTKNLIMIAVITSIALTAVASLPLVATAELVPDCDPGQFPGQDSDGDGICDDDEDFLGSDPCDPDSPYPSTVNQPPVAHAGAVLASSSWPYENFQSHLTIQEGEKVVLSAEGSYDPDGEINFYYWSWDDTKIAMDEQPLQRSFSVGEHIVTLEVQDNKGATDTATVIITVAGKKPKEKKIEDCDTYCKDALDENAEGKGTPPNCYCFCKKGYKLNTELRICERDCDYICKQKWGEFGEGSGKYPNCKCKCRDGPYELSEIDGECVENCDSQCKEKYGSGTVGSGDPASFGMFCDCDCVYPWQWNDDKTKCVLLVEKVCDDDTICEPDEGERCYNCPDCDCKKRPPFTKCGYDPSMSNIPLGYYDNTNCYVADPASYLAKDCDKLKKQIEFFNDAEFGFMKLSEKYQGGWPGIGYRQGYDPYMDDFIGPNTKAGKALQKMGYFYDNSEENKLAGRDGLENSLRLLTPPHDAFKSRIQSLRLVYEANNCEKLKYSNRAVKPGSDVTTIGSIIFIDRGRYYSNEAGTRTVRTKNGITLFKSEFEVEVKKDGTTIINLIEGHAQYYDLVDYDVTELESGQSIMIDADGRVSLPTEFDVEAMDKWWTSIEPEYIKSEYIESEYSELRITKLYTPEAHYNRYDIVIVYYRIENVGTKKVNEYQMRYNIIDPNGKTVHTHTGKKSSIDTGRWLEWRSEMWLVPGDSEFGEYTVDATLTWGTERGYEKQHAKTKFRVDWTSFECNRTCYDRYGIGAYGTIVNGECKCRCREGYTLDETTSKCVLKSQPTPGFEVVFAIVGLLAVAYLLRRKG